MFEIDTERIVQVMMKVWRRLEMWILRTTLDACYDLTRGYEKNIRICPLTSVWRIQTSAQGGILGNDNPLKDNG